MFSRKTIFSTLANISPEANNNGNSWEIVLIPNPNIETRKSVDLMLNAIKAAGGKYSISTFTGREGFEHNTFKLLSVSFPNEIYYPLHSQLKHGLKEWAKARRGKLLDFQFNTVTNCIDMIIRLQNATIHLYQYRDTNNERVSDWAITRCGFAEKEELTRQITEVITNIKEGVKK